jgi:hypothetical protein
LSGRRSALDGSDQRLNEADAGVEKEADEAQKIDSERRCEDQE